MEFKNEIQKRSLMLHVKCRKAASSGEAIRLQGSKQPAQGRYHLDAPQLLRLIHLCLLSYTRQASVSESHLKKVNYWFHLY
jgi:hypothetical protein